MSFDCFINHFVVGYRAVRLAAKITIINVFLKLGSIGVSILISLTDRTNRRCNLERKSIDSFVDLSIFGIY